MAEEVSTVIEKACGHVGLVRHRCVQDSISCTQCEAASREPVVVGIVRQVEVPANVVPARECADLECWIRQALGVDDGRQ